MAYVFIRPASDRDEYVIWDTEFEHFAAYGDRAEIAKDMEAIHPVGPPVEPRLRRADKTGSSAMGGWRFGQWHHGALIYEQRGYLPRRHLYRAAALQIEGRHAEVWDLLEPLEDGMEVRRG
ncbi:hypothetical protein ACFFX1_55530 [Dactylosporangium sucinum]|uniref:Uncharacterized protein n=1 Tax=Dactylosporangium sucinum TaxID=1424081 RepID=A0A917U4E2_9ACTN|nr:hypothetical protein [Dactylosporangium sucinum]GGM52552.1 hypothetical protein GCM10007977_062580 [Dactylosporangium sucinum]